jgi:choline dehydrogenase
MARDHADAVVCGGGTAGPVVASRLVEAGRRVVLLEAGPDHGPFDGGRWPADLLDATTIPTSHDWGYRSEDGRGLAFERARVIGGCSAHNGCTVSWGHRADYDGWNLPGWRATELEPTFRAVTARMRVRRFADDELTPFHAAFIAGGESLGLPREDRLDSLDIRPAVCAEPSNSPDGIRWNAAFAYLDPVRRDPRLEIRGDTLVDRVLIEGQRAVGVRAIGPQGAGEVRADLVVLCGGTYGSPAILLRSGVGPADDLVSLGIPPAADLPGVGGNLHDHPSFEVVIGTKDLLDERTAAFRSTGRAVPDEQGLASVASSWASDGIIDTHLFSEMAIDGRLGVFVACLTPRSRGRLSLRSEDPADTPILDHAYLTDPEGHDLGVLRDGVVRARRFLAAEPLSNLVREIEPGPTADLDTAIREGVIHYWHPVGTCAMGSVTDARGRVHGIDGLVVADASLVPQTVRATTNIPTLVVAERISAFLGS